MHQEAIVIYKATNLINNKVYIGSTKNFRQRLSQHKQQSRTGPFSNFQRAIRKYGFDNFKFEIICSVIDYNYADEIEQWFIDHFNSIKNGYNAVGVLKGSRELVSRVMKDEWAKPQVRKKRIENMRDGSQKKKIISVSIHSGQYRIYKSVHEALRDGFSTSCIYACLNNEAKKGQGYCWFYYEQQNPKLYVEKAKQLLGEFKSEYYRPIKAINKETGKELMFKNTFALKDQGFEAKAVRRVLRGEREGYKGFYWMYNDF